MLLFLSFLHWEEVDSLILEDFALLNLPHVGAQDLEGFIWSHWELKVDVASSCTVMLVSQIGHFRVD